MVSIARGSVPVALCLMASRSAALGLGSIEVSSGLGQPLRAAIPLLNAEEFGFFETYPPDPSNIFPWEPWHWRYYSPAERELRPRRESDSE